jgi:hypothetical protein
VAGGAQAPAEVSVSGDDGKLSRTTVAGLGTPLSSAAVPAPPSPVAAALAPPLDAAPWRADILALGWADGRVTRLVAGARVPGAARLGGGGDLALADPPSRWVGDWRGGLGARQCRDWDRPVLAVAGLAAAAVYLECRRGRTVTRRRWIAVPRGWQVAALVADQASAGGGVLPALTVLRRRGGWLCEAALDADEPVLVAAAELEAVAAGATVDWLPHPPAAPPRPEQVAWRAGYGPELDAQLQLVGSQPCAVLVGGIGGAGAGDDFSLPDRLELALPTDAACLWVAADARLGRRDLAWSLH